MKINLNTAPLSQIETECLVVPVLDTAESNNNGDKAKPKPQVQTNDKAVADAAADLIASGEVTGKMLELTLLHKPQGLKAKRLLLIGGGKAKKFTSARIAQAGRRRGPQSQGKRTEELCPGCTRRHR